MKRKKSTTMALCSCGLEWKIKNCLLTKNGSGTTNCPECGKEFDLSKTYLLEETYEVKFGDFLAWAIKKKYWMRGFDEISRSSFCDDSGEIVYGWGFVYTNQCGFVSDEDIRKDIPPKTASEWDAWGR